MPVGPVRTCSSSARGMRGVTGDGIRALAPGRTAVLVGMGGDELPLPLSVVQERELDRDGDVPLRQHVADGDLPGRSGQVDLDPSSRGGSASPRPPRP